jgi:flagellar biosynthesis repressor protein FlbT
MALKIDLKPHERLIIGGAVVANGNSRCELVVENNVVILRQKDILREKDASTPCKRIYFIVQLMYVDESQLLDKHNVYWALIKDVVEAAPSTARLLADMSEHIVNKRYYPALKLARKLIKYEEEATAHARTRAQCL